VSGGAFFAFDKLYHIYVKNTGKMMEIAAALSMTAVGILVFIVAGMIFGVIGKNQSLFKKSTYSFKP
jgi:biopolymer transport protein ExbB/TolQ